MSRIDAHHHFWRYSEAEYGWISEEMKALRRDFLLDDLRREMQSAHVDGTIAVQARQTEEETNWLLGLAEQSTALWGVVGWLPIADVNFERTLELYRDKPFLKGLRHVVQGEPEGFLEGEAFNRGIGALRRADLAYDLLLYAHQLPEATAFVDRHPEQPFVLDHIAKPRIRDGELQQWCAAVKQLAQRPHVVCKLSGMVTEADPAKWTANQLKPYFDTVLEAFGPYRLMVGTDWPVLTVGCSYAGWWQVVERWIAQLSEEERAAILGGTAMRVYRLESRARQVGA